VVLRRSYPSVVIAAASTQTVPGDVGKLSPNQMIGPNKFGLPTQTKGEPLPSKVAPGTPGQPGSTTPSGAGSSICASSKTDILTQAQKLFAGCGGAAGCAAWGPLAPFCQFLSGIQAWFQKHGVILIIGAVAVGGLVLLGLFKR